MSQADITLLGVGDVTLRDVVGSAQRVIQDPNPLERFALVAPVLKQADILFGQLEEVLANSDYLDQANYWNTTVKGGDKIAKVLAAVGFNVMSNASNIHYNAGPEALLQTMKHLRENNILPVGVGKNIAEARVPAVIERNGVKVAFLGYSSVLPKGGEATFEARAAKPGCNPMWINTFYDQIDYQPGTPPRIITFAEKECLRDMEEDIKNARGQADVVVMSFHWGIHHIPAVIAQYEYEVGHAAIDAGADLIFGHHPHLIKGIEVYKGKVVFHSLANFIKAGVDVKPGRRGYWEDMRPPMRELNEMGWSQATPAGRSSSEYFAPNYPQHEERQSTIAKAVISGKTKRIEKVSFIPLLIDEAHRPEPLFENDKRSEEVERYVAWATSTARMDTRFRREGDEVVIQTEEPAARSLGDQRAAAEPRIPAGAR
ncbi:MAG TPA: CapA family protein [Candidatus Limnocylindria bacterium]|jgi:poly-gamma-glutamate synthesis protein (capsule biosynthesis protein)|nr:CapA family protein [Candidatus Limnocylindria bacterium]